MEFEERRVVYHYTLVREDPKLLQQFLQYGNQSAIKELFSEKMNIINRCILVSKFRNVSVLFKLLDNADFVGNDEDYYESTLCIKGNFTEEVFARLQKTLTPRRYRHILQVLLIFFSRDINPKDAKDVLRLIWASTQEPIIIFKELQDALKHNLSLKEIKDIYDFYTEAVGTEASKLEPRSLKQLCRTMIRSELCRKNYWLPTVINEMDLPIMLKGFLNLDK